MLPPDFHLDALLSARTENEHLEFKEAKTQLDWEELFKYCVAFANEGGGLLVLGITDTHPRRVVGTQAFPADEDLRLRVFNTLNIRITTHIFDTDGKGVLVIDIPPRPRGTPLEYKGAYYMRIGSTLQPMTSERLRAIFSEGKPQHELQDAITGVTAHDVIQLLDTTGYFDLLNQPYPTIRQSVLDRLCTDQIITRERDDHWSITNLGALLFAKRFEAFPSLSNKGIRVIAYHGTDKLSTRYDRTGSRGYAIGFSGLVGFVESLTPTNERLSDSRREEIRPYPTAALRELIANALVHQDISDQGSAVHIEIYADRMEISNPGLPQIDTDRFIDEFRARNPSLAGLMRRTGICELKGSGIDRVISEVESHQLPAPDFRVGTHRFTAIMFGPQTFDSMNRTDRVRACYQHCCLMHVTNASRMTNQSLRERFKLPEDKSATISQVISATMESGKIKPADPNQTSTRYRSYLPYWA